MARRQNETAAPFKVEQENSNKKLAKRKLSVEELRGGFSSQSRLLSVIKLRKVFFLFTSSVNKFCSRICSAAGSSLIFMSITSSERAAPPPSHVLKWLVFDWAIEKRLGVAFSINRLSDEFH